MGIGKWLIPVVLLPDLVRLVVPWRYRKIFERIGRGRGVDPDLLHAIAWWESGMNARAVSPINRNGTRDYGLMQINESNFAKLGLNRETALDPERSVEAAATLIADSQRPRALTLPDTISVYNAGPSAAGGPRRNKTGQYINPNYVVSVMGRLSFVRLASVAPIHRLLA